MTIHVTISETQKDASTETSRGKLLSNHDVVNDEMFLYVELTERLIRILSREKLSDFSETKASLENKNTLPLRKSLFPHVPPFIIFCAAGKKSPADSLPREIRKHLLWWHSRQYSPSIIRSIVLKSGFAMTLKFSANWCGTWCSRSAYARFRSTKPYQKINHFPNSAQLSNKVLLCRSFRRMATKHGGSEFDYMPMSFILPCESKRLRKWMKRSREAWILKPPNNCAGRGIRIISRWYEVPEENALVAQRYLNRPRLIDGAKFDLRLYVLVTSLDPLRLYIYSEGLVRVATGKYSYDARTLYDRYVHLTNTSVNKFSPRFKSNDDPDSCKGNMWSLKALWKYLVSQESIDVGKIWLKIKDIAVKTLISAEAPLVRSLKAHSTTLYNSYQLYGFDVLLDENLRPWLLEVNDCPSMDPDTPLCGFVKSQLVSDYLNLLGFHVPDVLSRREQAMLRRIYGAERFCFDRNLYSANVSDRGRKKMEDFFEVTAREEYLKSILKNITSDDLRILIRHEDEIARAGRFERIFPTSETHEYFKFFEEVRYNDMLLDAWETEYADDKSAGIRRLKELCSKKCHLSRTC